VVRNLISEDRKYANNSYANKYLRVLAVSDLAILFQIKRRQVTSTQPGDRAIYRQAYMPTASNDTKGGTEHIIT
jgi:hypothetical protein